MAQTGYTPISLYHSATAGHEPTATNLVDGELAINTADGKLFYKNSSGTVTTYAPTPGGIVPIANGGTNTTTTPTAGAVAYGTGTAYGFTGTGTVGQVLQSTGTSAPVWAAAPATIGTLQYFAGPTTSTYPPSNWLKADGSIVTQTAYPTLYSIVGLTANNFTTSTLATLTSNVYKVVYGNNIYVGYSPNVASGSLTKYSADLTSWNDSGTTTTALIAVSYPNPITYGNGKFVLAALSGQLFTSTDGNSWVSRSSGTTTALNAVAYANNQYIYFGRSGVSGTSTDAITWVSRSAAATGLNSVSYLTLTYANSLYVIAGLSGQIATSTDAITWTQRTSGTSSPIHALTYISDSNMFLAIDNAGRSLTSTDGATWTVRANTANGLSATAGYYNVSYANNMIYVSGVTGVYTSPDGYNFTQRIVDTSAIYSFMYANSTNIYFTGNLYVSSNNPFTYNTAVEFALPQQQYPQTSLTYAQSKLYVRAS